MTLSLQYFSRCLLKLNRRVVNSFVSAEQVLMGVLLNASLEMPVSGESLSCFRSAQGVNK